MAADRAFTYEPGTSWLHSWSTRELPFFRLRIASKALIFSTTAFVVARLYDLAGSERAAVFDLLIIAVVIALLGRATNFRKARALARDLLVAGALLAVMVFVVLIPIVVFGQLSALDIRYKWSEIPTLLVNVFLMFAATLSLAGLFMATTSLADIIAAVPGRGKTRMFLSLTLIGLALAEPSLTLRQEAIRGLSLPADDTWLAKIGVAFRWPLRSFYLLATLVWQTIAIDSVPVYLALLSDANSGLGN